MHNPDGSMDACWIEFKTADHECFVGRADPGDEQAIDKLMAAFADFLLRPDTR